jgi:hypothetical protein
VQGHDVRETGLGDDIPHRVGDRPVLENLLDVQVEGLPDWRLGSGGDCDSGRPGTREILWRAGVVRARSPIGIWRTGLRHAEGICSRPAPASAGSGRLRLSWRWWRAPLSRTASGCTDSS